MIEPESSTHAAFRIYGALKSASQVATYIGIAATAILSVYDLLHKEIAEPDALGKRLVLTKSGKTHVITLLVISLLTIASTILKDISDSKLDSMRDSINYERAQADLRKALGGSFQEFTEKTMQPSISLVGKNIEAETQVLHSSISRAVASLNSALDDSRSDIQRSAIESGLEAEMSDSKLDSYILEIGMPYDSGFEKRNTPIPRLAEWSETADKKCYQSAHPFDDATSRACLKLISSVQALTKLEYFANALDPRDSGPVQIFIHLRSFMVYIYIPLKCDPTSNLPSPISYPYPYREGTVGCLQIFDTGDIRTSNRAVHILDNNLIFPPQIRIIESGAQEDQVGNYEVPFKERLFGRDADILGVSLSATGNGTHLGEALPKKLVVTEYLNSSGSLKRSYILRLNSIGKDDLSAGRLMAEYGRF